MGSVADRPYADCPHCGMPVWSSGCDSPAAMQFCPHCRMPVWDQIHKGGTMSTGGGQKTHSKGEQT
jgi:hypothetical protein